MILGQRKHNYQRNVRQYRVTSQPIDEPISLETVKNHLKVDFSADDALINSLIITAREFVENYTLLRLMPQTITEHFDVFVSPLELSCAPLRSVSSISYLDSDSQSVVLGSIYKSQQYALLPRLVLKANESWPTTVNEQSAITVVYTVGFDDADAVPEILKSAMLLMISHWYENRQDTVRRMPTMVEFMIRPYRIMI